jgi:glycosyltransferase involved in cell wall biosynthesis
MKIAQVAPLYESVPPKAYGGTERIVSYLTEELVKSGHQVTLFASGDSTTDAKLVSICNKSLRLGDNKSDYIYHLIEIQEVIEQSKEFDVIHFHIDCLYFPVSNFLKTPHFTTLHGRLDIPALDELYDKFHEIPLVSISHSQREAVPRANWQANVYHGIPENLYRLNLKPEPYLAFIGRISPEKGLDKAIEIAIKTGMKLKIAAKIDIADQEYYDRDIKHLLSHPLIEFIGEINDLEKNEFLGNASCLLFPIDWPEPFGLVMIEAMACGTPVIAFKSGSVKEVIDDGLSGIIVNDVEEAIKALPRALNLSRLECRQIFEKRFTAKRMADDYLQLYKKLSSKLQDSFKMIVLFLFLFVATSIVLI